MAKVRLQCNRCRENFEYDVELQSREDIFLSNEEKVEELAIGTKLPCAMVSHVNGMTDVCVVIRAEKKHKYGSYNELPDQWIEVETKTEEKKQKLPLNVKKPMSGRKKIAKPDQ